MAAAARRSLHFWMVLILFVTTIAFDQDGSQFIYNGFRGANLHLDGNATVYPNGLLQLTNTSGRQQSGHAFYPLPIKFNISSSKSLVFSTCFVFAVVPQVLNFSGHGMTFVISPSMDFSGATAIAYLGLLNSSNDGLPTNHMLAVELDTVGSPEFKDIDDNHVGINVNSMTSNDSATASYFSEKEGKNINLMLISGKPIQIWIDYDGAEMLLNVTVAPISIRTKPSRPLLSNRIDLSPVLQDTMYVGFTAATGDVIKSYHYVLGWSFSRSGKTERLDVTKLPPLPPPAALPRKGSMISKVMLIAVIVAVVFALITVGGAVYIVRKKKYEEVYEDWEREYSPHRFSYMALYKATNGFKDREIIGEGGFGKVYRGVLPSSDEVAVKKVSHNSGKQGMQQFVSEIVSMGRLRHRNLVQLRGYCRRKGELLLVYDYMRNGSLDKVLYKNIRPNLNWFQRLRILRGVACGLLYLHEEWEKVVLHRDIKPANVLLDADLNGKLGDFGLARLYDHDSIPQTTHLVGTVGYLAPELVRTGQATTNTDVYAFGAFMLEVACGRKPIEHGKEDLVVWVIGCWNKGSILDASDPRLEGLYVGEEMELVLKLGLFCSHPNPAARPSMRHVTQYLDGDAMFPDVSPSSELLDVFRASCNESSKMTPFSSLFESGTSSQVMSASMDSLLVGGR